jgi:hypothetical protein
MCSSATTTKWAPLFGLGNGEPLLTSCVSAANCGSGHRNLAAPLTLGQPARRCDRPRRAGSPDERAVGKNRASVNRILGHPLTVRFNRACAQRDHGTR